MSYRRFTDSGGTVWRVWDVVPAPVDRRLAMRRIRSVRIQHPERRVLPDRRVDMRRSGLYFAPAEKPWLCFECESTLLRLRPAPQDWAARGDAELEALRALAERQASFP